MTLWGNKRKPRWGRTVRLFLIVVSVFLTAKPSLITGMVIGTATVLTTKLMYDQNCKRKEASLPADTPQQGRQCKSKTDFKTY